MTGRDKFEAAFSRDGTPEFPAAICYHGIFLRDHWEEVTRQPWWMQFEPHPERAALPWIDMIKKTGEDWFPIMLGSSHERRRMFTIEATPDGPFRVWRTGKREALPRPPVGGNKIAWTPVPGGIKDIAQLDAIMDDQVGPRGVSGLHPPEVGKPAEDGSLDLPRILLKEFGAEKLPLAAVGAPFWSCCPLWGFEGLMTELMDSPDLVEHATRRFAEHAIRQVQTLAEAGAEAIWVEDCMTDMLSPQQFRRLNLPALRDLTDAIRAAGMYSVYYYCGNPNDRWELLLDSGADALSLEEGKNGFDIDIETVVERVNGRTTLLGNLDAIGLLGQASEDQLRAEVVRQCRAGRRNRNRFIMSIGSPVTPATPLSRVQLYCDMVHGFR